MLTPGCPRVDRAWCQRLKLKYDEPLSSFAFNFNLRHYVVDWEALERSSSEYPNWVREAFEILVGTQVKLARHVIL